MLVKSRAARLADVVDRRNINLIIIDYVSIQNADKMKAI